MLLANQQVELNFCNQRFVIGALQPVQGCWWNAEVNSNDLPRAENPTENPWVLRFDDVYLGYYNIYNNCNTNHTYHIISCYDTT